MSDMSERIAKAIMSDLADRSGILDGIDDDVLAEMRDSLASAVLSALHDPSTAMLIAGVKAMRNPDLDVTEKELALGWRAMISKAMEG